MYKSSLNKIKISPYKARLVVDLVRGLPAWKACEVLKFTRKRVAQDIRKLIMSAMANASHNYRVDEDTLYVKEIYVGKSMMLRRMHCRARGRGNIIRKPYSNIYLVLDSEGGTE